MADDLDDIEDLLEAPYKNEINHHPQPEKTCNGNGNHHNVSVIFIVIL